MGTAKRMQCGPDLDKKTRSGRHYDRENALKRNWKRLLETNEKVRLCEENQKVTKKMKSEAVAWKNLVDLHETDPNDNFGLGKIGDKLSAAQDHIERVDSSIEENEKDCLVQYRQQREIEKYVNFLRKGGVEVE